MLKIISIFTLIWELTYGYINIYPSFFLKELKNEGTTETFVLSNRTNDEVRYRLYIEENITNENNINVEIYPKSITLSPLEQKEVKVLIKPILPLQYGNYTKKLVVKEILIPNKRKKKILTEFKMNLELYYGNIPLKIESQFEFKKNNLKLDLKNTGDKIAVLNIYMQENTEENFIDSLILRKNDCYSNEVFLKGSEKALIIRDENGKEIKKIQLEGMK